MSQQKPEFPVQSHLLWRHAWLSLWENRRIVLAVVFMFIFAPQIISETYLAGHFLKNYQGLIGLSEQGSLTILQLLSNLQEGLISVAVAIFLNIVLLTLGFTCILNIASGYFRSEPVPPLGSLITVALSKFPKTFFVLMFLLFFFGLVQAVLPPLILVVVPLIMAPTLYNLEGTGVFASLREAVTLRFIKGSNIPKFSVYFTLLGYLGFLILALYLAIMMGNYVLGLDESFALFYSFTNRALSGWPFSPAYLTFELLFVGTVSMASAYFISLTVCFYYYVKQRHNRLPAEGVEA